LSGKAAEEGGEEVELEPTKEQKKKTPRRNKESQCFELMAFPAEVRWIIFQYLSKCDQKNVCLVCRSLYKEVMSLVWRTCNIIYSVSRRSSVPKSVSQCVKHSANVSLNGIQQHYGFWTNRSSFYVNMTILNALCPDVLRSLTLAGLGVCESMLYTVCKLNKLKKLELAFQDTVEDHVLTQLGQLRQLTDLSLSVCNDLSDSGLKEIYRKLYCLNKLKLSYCGNITSEAFDEINTLPQLKELDLQYCTKISDGVLLHVSSLKRLEALSLEGVNDIRGEGLVHLANLSSLLYLDLTYCYSITDSAFSNYFALKPRIRALNISDCDITDLALVGIEKAHFLQELVLDDNGSLTRACMDHIVSIRSLRRLSMAYCGCTNNRMASLSRMQHLNMGGSEAVVDQDIEKIATIKTLTKLSLADCQKWSGDAMRYIVALPHLTLLDLSEVHACIDAAMVHVGAMHGLLTLGLSYSSISDVGLKHIRALPALQVVDLSFCREITDAGLLVLRDMTTLRRVSVYFCDGISDVGRSYVKGISVDYVVLDEIFTYRTSYRDLRDLLRALD